MTKEQLVWAMGKSASLVTCLVLAACGSTPNDEAIVGKSTSELVRLENRAIALGGAHTCIILNGGTNNGRVKCWGRNDWGQLGLGNTQDRGDGPNEMGNNLAKVSLGTTSTGVQRKALALAAGSHHTCALLDNNQVKCWGLNDFGQLGIGGTGGLATNRGDGANEMGNNLPQVNLGTGRSAKAIAAGNTFSCALLDTNQIKCWGINTWGNLGIGSTTTQTAPTSTINFGTGRSVKSFALGSYHGCAILDNNQLKCWGANYNGQLGLGNTTDMVARGDAPGETSSSLVTNLGTGRIAQAVDAGGHHTCALLDDGTVKCWGLNQYGQLGIGDIDTRGDSPNEMGDFLPIVNTPTGVWGGISAGRGEEGATCIIGTLAEVQCWGQNLYGGLGIGVAGPDQSIGDQPDEVGGVYTDLGFDPSGTWYSTIAIGTGAYHTCAGVHDGNLKCWGLNDHGQLGHGDTANIGDDFAETGGGIPVVNVGN